MASSGRSRVTLSTVVESLQRVNDQLQAVIETFRAELHEKNQQIAQLQQQLQMALDDKFFKPETPARSDPKANQLADPEAAGDQPEFSEEGDAAAMQGETGDVDAAIEKIAAQAGFAGWNDEHRQ